MSYRELREEQARQIIDVEQLFETYKAARRERHERFSGAMSWKSVAGRDYLYRKRSGVWKSLGPRALDTETTYAAFCNGRERVDERLATLSRRLDDIAPVNRALALGRVPHLVARVLRALDAAGLLGSVVEVVGTNALFAYERLGGVQIESGHLATGDIDLLFDARARLKIAAAEGRSAEGLTDILRKVDQSFAPTGRDSFRAVNRDGFMVDLITPAPRRNRLASPRRDRLSSSGEDLRAVEIEGLDWLLNSPKVHATAIDARGYPLSMTVPDPRAFALHKAWLARRPDRDPLKAGRDGAQARLVARLVAERLKHLSFDDASLLALPGFLREGASLLLTPPVAGSGERREERQSLEPDW